MLVSAFIWWMATMDNLRNMWYWTIKAKVMQDITVVQQCINAFMLCPGDFRLPNDINAKHHFVQVFFRGVPQQVDWGISVECFIFFDDLCKI